MDVKNKLWICLRWAIMRFWECLHKQSRNLYHSRIKAAINSYSTDKVYFSYTFTIHFYLPLLPPLIFRQLSRTFYQHYNDNSHYLNLHFMILYNWNPDRMSILVPHQPIASFSGSASNDSLVIWYSIDWIITFA